MPPEISPCAGIGRAEAEAALQSPANAVGSIERLPKWLLCVPLVAQWFWLGARYRSLTLPSAANPDIETGGLAGESKAASLLAMQAAVPHLVARTVLVPPGQGPERARLAAGLRFPLIAKPDIGWCGYGVRLVRDAPALSAYAECFPGDAAYLLQHFVAAPNEAGLFYMRECGSPTGRLRAATRRHPPRVTGDGTSTLDDLIAADPRTRPNSALYRHTHGAAALRAIPPAGHVVPLATIASLRAGARYEDISAQITPALEAAVQEAAAALGRFHFGRFDVRFDSLAELRAGRFQIIEVNGAGAEAIQFWDPRLGLVAAFAGIFAKQRLAFALGAAMREAGVRPVGTVALSRAWLKQQSLIARYPTSN